MPLLSVSTSVPELSSDQASALLERLGKSVARLLGKPEAYVMTMLRSGIPMTFAGTAEPACYVELKSIGRFSPELTERVSSELCTELGSSLGVPSKRIYIEFAEAVGHMWGFDGGTFG